MNVLSLFDGMSCGHIALRELEIPIEHYYASEVDKYAIAQTQLNFPDTIQIGDVCQVHAKDLPKIDLLIGGSPCQGFSFAGQQLAFEDPRSKLFFEFVRIWKEVKEINPNAKFLLENVRMKSEFERVITEYMGIQPVIINSSLVSAQNRLRLYWSNIRVREEGLFRELVTDIPQPEDRGLFIKDVLDDNVAEKYFIKESVVENMQAHKQRQREKGNGFGLNPRRVDEKMSAVTVSGKGVQDLIYISAMRGRESVVLTPRRTEYGKQIRKQYEAGEIKEQRKNLQQLEPRYDGKSNTLNTVQKDNLVAVGTWRTYKEDRGFRPLKGDEFGAVTARARQDGIGQNCVIQVNPSKESGGKQPYQQNRVYDSRGKSPALLAELGGRLNVMGSRIRRLTPTECARLQTIPDWYKWGCSETQQYKMLGNGWTVEVIKHIFKYLKK